LAGVWRLRDDNGAVTYYHVGHVGDELPGAVMRVTGIRHNPDRKMEQFDELLIFPTTIGDASYLNVCGGTDAQIKLLQEKGWTKETVNEYLIFRYQAAENELTVRALDGEAKKRAIEAGKIGGTMERNDQGQVSKFYFTDTSENLARFVQEAGDELFSHDAVRLQRVP